MSADSASLAAAVPIHRPTRILVVDDDPIVRHVLSRFLTREGYEAITAVNGKEALKVIHQEIPDVLLIDVRMPVMDGLSVCRAMRADFRTRGLPIVLLTGNGGVEDRVEGYKTGADDFVTKPFNLDELKIRIEGALQRRQWDQLSHPLTHLPGSLGIEEEVRKRISLEQTFAFAYIDIDHFKAFNDVYGYDAGDQVIKAVGNCLIDAISEYRGHDIYPAHIGGDDFVLIADIDVMRELLPKVLQRFDVLRLSHHREDDILKGSLIIHNRQGQLEEFPLMALSAAVVSTQTRTVTYYARLAEVASELKSFVKSQPHHGKSLLFWDRQSDPNP